jgi:hypothetical protein
MVSGRDRQYRVRAAAAGARAAGHGSDVGCEGRGDRRPATSDDGVAPAGCPPQVHPVGSAGAGGPGQAVAAGAVVGPPRNSGHAAALAPGAGAPPLDLSTPARPAARTGAVGRRSGASPGPGEPTVGLPADHRRMRPLGVTVSATSVRNILRRHRLGPAPRRGGPSWTEFPARPGRWGVGLRLSLRRDDRLVPALRPVRHRTRLAGVTPTRPEPGSPSKPVSC